MHVCLRFVRTSSFSAVLWLALAGAGCQPVHFYYQAINGQLEIATKAEKINDILSDSAASKELKTQLIKVRTISDFAKTNLGLKKNQSYNDFVDLNRPFVVWNVVATPEFSFSPEEWCFPIAGCVNYRGYFSKSDAISFAKKQRERNLDAVVLGVTAFSTLGWFNDPVLSTFSSYSDIHLVRILFHELAHQIVYIRGDTTFNESFAVSVEKKGVELWLRKKGSPEDIQSWLDYQKAKKIFLNFMEKERLRLRGVYESQRSPTQKRREKQNIIMEMHREFALLKKNVPIMQKYSNFFDQPINNAVFASLKSYSGLVPFFDKLLEENDNLQSFILEVKQMQNMSENDRQAFINSSNHD